MSTIVRLIAVEQTARIVGNVMFVFLSAATLHHLREKKNGKWLEAYDIFATVRVGMKVRE